MNFRSKNQNLAMLNEAGWVMGFVGQLGEKR